MTASFVTRRTGIAGCCWFAVILLWFFGVGSAHAQERRDTLPPDTLVLPIPPEQVEQDTVPTDEAPVAQPDSLVAAPTMPPYPQPLPTGFAVARWKWDREDLLRFHGLSLLDLLERVPGLAVTRAGGFGRPAGLTALGLGGGRVRVLLDGFELDPLSAATPDLQQIGIVDLESVTLERDLQGIRIELTTFRLPDSRPFSQLEIGAGSYQAKLLRAFLARPVGQRNIFSGGFDLVTTQGFGVDEPFRVTNGRLRWSYLLRPEIGLQAEYRQSSVNRSGRVFPEEGERRDLLLRGRALLMPGLTVDGLVGRSWRSGGGADPFPIDLQVNHAMARAAYGMRLGWVEGAARLRFGDDQAYAAPSSDLSLRAALQPLPWLLTEGEVRGTGTGDVRGLEVSGLVRVGPALGLSAFAQVASGARGLGLFRDTLVAVVGEDGTQTDSLVTEYLFPTVSSDAGGLRAGLEWQRGGATLGGALLALEPTEAVPFGLPFDRGVAPLTTGAATGFETFFLLPLPMLRGTVQLEGWYSRFTESDLRPYLPTEQGRVALQYHALFSEGQFEPTVRLEAVRRGSALAPSFGAETFDGATQPYDLLNFFLQLRIIDLRAFLVIENFLNNQVAADLPEQFLPGPRTLYGVRWHFWN